MDNRNLLKRENYKDIERFSSYELTNSVAFELAIRNKRAKRLLGNYYLNRPLFSSNELYEVYEDILLNEFYLGYSSIQYLGELFEDKKRSMAKSLLLNSYTYDEYLDYLDLFEDEQIEEIEEYWTNQNYTSDEQLILYDKFIKQEFKQIEIYTMQVEEDNENKYQNYMVDKITSLQHSDNIKYSRDLIPSDTDSGLPFVEKNPTVNIDRNKFIKFKRPKLEPPHNITLEIDLKINLNLPIKDLTAYIKEIKTLYNRDETMLISVKESLNEDTIKHTEMKAIIYSMNASEWADCFFMYDFFTNSTDKVFDKHNDIINELTYYNGYKIKGKKKTLSYEVYQEFKDNYKSEDVNTFYKLSTIKTRLQIMKQLIENKEYRYLITNIK